MIASAKAFARRHWPELRLRTILLATLIFSAALPGFGALFLRVYENTLVRQTEAELVAQGAALAATADTVWPGALPGVPRFADYAPEPPAIDLSEGPVLGERPAPHAANMRPDPVATRAAALLAPVFVRTSHVTLASIVLVDRSGIVATGSHAGARLSGVAELDSALAGRPQTVLRRNGAYRPRYAFEWLSRASPLRIHHARPIVVDGRVVGALLLSRSPRALFRGIYQDRAKILLGVGLILGTLIVLTGLLSRGIARPIEALSAATRSVATGRGTVPDVPATAAIEIRALYRDFAVMAAAIDRRSRYLRDFAAAVSHEFKTPLAGISGAIELLEDHHATMTESERRRFLANMGADADRLGHLVTRLLDLARADMAQPKVDVVTAIDGPLLRTVDAYRSADFAIDIVLPDRAQTVAIPATTIEAVLATLLENSRQAGARHVAIEVKWDAGNLMLFVLDDGPGSSGGSCPNLRAILHDEAKYGRHRPGPVDRAIAARSKRCGHRACGIGIWCSVRDTDPADPSTGV